MRAVRRVVGRAVALDRADVDTDQIIPAHWLRRIERTGYGAGLFEAWRRDPSFPLNDPARAGASILIAGPNFGCGSSREHAAWALEDAGFRAIVAPSFADIFRQNCLAVGLVAAQVEADAARALMRLTEGDPTTEVVVDVEERVVRAPRIEAPFPLDDFAQWRLLNGLDDIALTLRHREAIAAYEARRAAWLPRAEG